MPSAQAEVRAAVRPGDITRVLLGLLERAEKGDNNAARVWLDRVCGRPSEASAADLQVPFELPDLATIEGVAELQRRVVHAFATGELSAAQAEKLATMGEMLRRGIETHELAQRIAALEVRSGVPRLGVVS